MDMRKFMVVGVAGGLSSMANAMSTVSAAAAHVATHTISNGAPVQKALETVADPANSGWLLQNPAIVVGAIATVVILSGAVVAAVLVSAFKDMNKRQEEGLGIVFPEKEETPAMRMKEMRNKYYQPDSNPSLKNAV